MSRSRPPRLATWLLECFLADAEREAILGDLLEEHGIRIRTGSPSDAARWYWSQVGRSLLPVLHAGVRRGGWLVTTVVAVDAYLLAGTIEFVGTGLMARALSPAGLAFWLLSAIVGLATMMLGGYVAAWIRPAAAPVLAAIVMLVVLALFATAPGSAPLWYGLAFLVFGPVAALAGGALRRIKRVRSA